MTVTSQFLHLGLTWKEGKVAPDIGLKISSARRTAYFLSNVGLHGCKGQDDTTSMDLTRTYVSPCLLHGLEAVVLNKSQMQEIESFYSRLLRQAQGLHESTATEAIYLLMTLLPVEAISHLKISLYGAITRLDYTNPLHQVALRQMAIATQKDSWFVFLQKIVAIHGIDVHQVLHNPWPKTTWKFYCKFTVRQLWLEKLLHAAANKASLS